MKNAGEVAINGQTLALADIWRRASPELQEYIAAMHQHYESEFVRVKEAVDAESVAANVNHVLDQFIAEHLATAQQAKDIRCGRGCAHCCRINVTITIQEAHLLLAWAEHLGIEVDWARVERQAQHPGTGWAELAPPDRTCVFLSKAGDCQVYEHRPMACRKHFALSDPANCNASARRRRVLTFVSPHAEVVASAAYAVFENRSMPLMLLKARQAKEAAVDAEEAAP
jgi:Fe-S-cluster containining protein